MNGIDTSERELLKRSNELESNVRYYSRVFPDVFHKASGSYLYNEQGKAYLDFFTGAGALNYGHNHPILKAALLDYLAQDGVIHSLDMSTPPHIQFIIDFHEKILKPRNLEYKIQFTGPTGANAIEAALKLARKYTKRTDIIYFSDSYHGLSLGALSVSHLKTQKDNIHITFPHTQMLSYDIRGETEFLLKQTQEMIEKLPQEKLPAAIILETVQGQGGINSASDLWLEGIARIAKKWGILLIVDDIQAGCGRTGRFFSFEQSKIHPDIVCLSKSLSGYGLPLSIMLLKPELDVWYSGEHTGTFRSNNLALVSGTKAIQFWLDEPFKQNLKHNVHVLDDRLQGILEKYPGNGMHIKGRGLIRGIAWSSKTLAKNVSQAVFSKGLIAEAVGREDGVLKIMPPLLISMDDIQKGMDIIEVCIKEIVT